MMMIMARKDKEIRICCTDMLSSTTIMNATKASQMPPNKKNISIGLRWCCVADFTIVMELPNV
jgi:hypothetical protein